MENKLRQMEQVAVDFARNHDHSANAISINREIIKLDPSNINAHFRLAKCFVTMGDFASAKAHYHAISRIDPANKIAPRKLCELEELKEEGKPEAEPVLGKFLGIPTNFKLTEIESTGNIKVSVLGLYYSRSRFPEKHFNDLFSQKILEAKDGCEKVLDVFSFLIHRNIPEDVVVCVAPSSDAQKTDTGIRRIGEMLLLFNRQNGLDCLIRHSSILPAHLYPGRSRSPIVHLESIKCCNHKKFDGRDVVLLDDIRTTGSTLKVCATLLLNRGARHVHCIALGQTAQDE